MLSFTERHYAECFYTERLMLSVVVLNVIMLNVVARGRLESSIALILLSMKTS